jgi:hypothetical protein
VGFFDGLGQIGKFIQEQVGSHNAMMRYGPNWREKFEEEQRQMQHAQIRRAQDIERYEFQDQQMEQARSDRPLERRGLEARTAAAELNLESAEQKRTDEEDFFEGFGREYNDKNKNAMNAFNKGSATHKMDPASDVSPPPKKSGREAYQESKGASSFFDMEAKTATNKVTAANQEFLGSPEGQEFIEDDRARNVEDKELNIALKQQRLKEMRENATGGSPATKRKIQTEQQKFFTGRLGQIIKDNDRSVEEYMAMEEARVIEDFQDRIDDAQSSGEDIELIGMQQQLAMRKLAEQKEQIKKTQFLTNGLTAIPRNVINDVMEGAPLGQHEARMVNHFMMALNGLGIGRRDAKQYAPKSTLAFLQAVQEGYQNGTIPLPDTAQ